MVCCLDYLLITDNVYQWVGKLVGIVPSLSSKLTVPIPGLVFHSEPTVLFAPRFCYRQSSRWFGAIIYSLDY